MEVQRRSLAAVVYDKDGLHDFGLPSVPRGPDSGIVNHHKTARSIISENDLALMYMYVLMGLPVTKEVVVLQPYGRQSADCSLRKR